MDSYTAHVTPMQVPLRKPWIGVRVETKHQIENLPHLAYSTGTEHTLLTIVFSSTLLLEWRAGALAELVYPTTFYHIMLQQGTMSPEQALKAMQQYQGGYACSAWLGFRTSSIARLVEVYLRFTMWSWVLVQGTKQDLMGRPATRVVAYILAGLAVVTFVGGGTFHQLSVPDGSDSAAQEGQLRPQRLQGRHTTAYVEEPQPQLRTKRRKAHSHIRIQRFHARTSGSSRLQLPERDAKFEEDLPVAQDTSLSPGPSQLVLQKTEGAPSNSTGVLTSAEQVGSQGAPVNVKEQALLQSPGPGPQDAWKDQYMAMCLAVRDQHLDIREWILHHASIGYDSHT
jgi:hypothetical protein